MNKEIIKYIFFGVLTTAVNYVTYFGFVFFGMHYAVSNALSIIIAILFAYITNKLYVFGSETNICKEKLSEFLKFTGGRALTGLLDMGLMVVLVESLLIRADFSKIFVSLIMIVLNYLISKIFVFKK